MFRPPSVLVPVTVLSLTVLFLLKVAVSLKRHSSTK